MKFMQSSLAILLVAIGFGDAAKIVLYEFPNYRGDSITVDLTSHGCYNLPSEFDDRTSSIYANKNCIYAYELSNCGGRFEIINSNRVSLDDFDNEISSVQFCPNQPQAQHTTSAPHRPPPQPPSNNERDLGKLAATEHNRYRRKHNVPDLQADYGEVQRHAQEHADYLARHDKFHNSNGNRYGENLAWLSGVAKKEDAVRDSIALWYKGESHYDYNRPGFSRDSGGFSQMVWKSTSSVGIGVAWNSRQKRWVVVASYYPAGNIEGRYKENVNRPSH